MLKCLPNLPLFYFCKQHFQLNHDNNGGEKQLVWLIKLHFVDLIIVGKHFMKMVYHVVVVVLKVNHCFADYIKLGIFNYDHHHLTICLG